MKKNFFARYKADLDSHWDSSTVKLATALTKHDYLN
jgi:hypothetical protein